MKTLDSIFQSEDISSGVLNSQVHNAGEKLIKSPNTGARVIVPAYEIDYTFKDDKQKTQLRLSSLTQNNWNWERFITKHKVYVDRTHQAVGTFDRHSKDIPEE